MPFRGCKDGSIATPSHTSVIRLAVMSQMSLWRLLGNLPLGQSMASETLSPARKHIVRAI